MCWTFTICSLELCLIIDETLRLLWSFMLPNRKLLTAFFILMCQQPTLKLIPAMKGGREKNGIASPTENRHVNWAPDVYDPPVTSVCHSVTNSYQRRSKHRKKEKNKQKKKQKGKSKKNQQNSTQNSSVPQVSDLGYVY